jgi:hypothetical protein
MASWTDGDKDNKPVVQLWSNYDEKEKEGELS